MPAKPVRVPGVFKKPVPQKKFEKGYVKYIEHPQDKKFFIECFEQQDDTYVIRSNLTKDNVKRLNGILKWVKRNKKGPIKVVPIIFAAAVTAAVIIFFTVFANPLLGSALESALEAIFEGKSDVHNFRLSVLKFRVNIGGITVANRDAPMTNLFELGSTTISLKPEAVLRGKVYIEDISANDIKFGTARKTSGALPERPKKEKKKKEKAVNDGPPMIDFANFDAMALLNQEYDKLSTPKLYDEAIEAYNTILAKWEGQVDNAKKKAEELQKASQPLLSMNAASFNVRDVEAITKTVQDITTMVNTAQSAADDATKMISGIETDINMARQLEQNARNALNDDINHLKSYLDLGGGAAFSALEPFIRDMLSDTAEQYVDYGLRAMEALEKIKELSAASASKPKEEKPKKVKKIAFKGRDVPYPVVSYPQFYLGTFKSDITQGSWKGAFDLSDVSSDPNLTNKPVSLTVDVTEVSGSLRRQVSFNGKADFRNNPPEKFNAIVDGTGFPVSLGNQLSQAGINGFSGNAAFNVFLAGYGDGGVSGGGGVKLIDARLIDPKGTIAEAAAVAVQEAKTIDLGVQYIHHIGKNDEFKVTTNIADLIAQVLKRTAEAYAKKAMDDIEKALRDKINQYIDGKFVSKDELDLLFRSARGDKAALDQVKNSLTNKKNEFEQKIRGAADEAVQQAKEEATRQAEQAAKDALKGQTPSLPSLPSGGIKKLW